MLHFSFWMVPPDIWRACQLSTQYQRYQWSKKWHHPIPISDLKIDSDLNYDELQSDIMENCNQCKKSMQQSNCSHFIKYIDLLKYMVLWAITAQDHTAWSWLVMPKFVYLVDVMSYVQIHRSICWILFVDFSMKTSEPMWLISTVVCLFMKL